MRGAVACILLVGTVAVAGAEPRSDEAAKHADLGSELFAKKDYDGALAEFEAAYRQSRSWKVLVHVGVTQSKLRRYGDALRTLEQYLKLGGDEVPASLRALVQRELETIRPMLVTVTVVVEGGPAELVVDHAAARGTPLAEPLLLGPGEHTFKARRAGFEPAEVKRTFLAGRRERVVLELRPERGVLRVESRPDGATLILDGREVGRTAWENPVAAGRHEVALRLRGFLVKSTSVVIQPGGRVPLAVELVAEPPPPRRPWYKRWYWWTAIGAVVVGGVVTGAVVGTRPHYALTLRAD